jgi:cobalt-zinc-cadmium efflux system protein
MGIHSHGHGHHHANERTGAVLRFSLIATLIYIVLLVVMGYRSHSLALFSEAGHNLSDFLALLLSWVAIYFQSRPPDSTRTYGYHRAGVLAAFVNALTLVGIAIFIFFEALERLRTPVDVHAKTVVWVAAIGVVLNGAIAGMLWSTSRDVNIRSAFIHQLGDTLSTAAVIVGGAVMIFTGMTWIDPVLSIGIAALVLWSSFDIIRETLNILLEGTPRGLKVADIVNEIKAREGVLDVHDLHVWSIGSEVHTLSCHVLIADIPLSESDSILRDVKRCLEERFHIVHTTIQFEHAGCETEHECVMPVHTGHSHTHSH